MYKVLIKLYIPEIEETYEMYIPINKTISQVLVLINKLVNNLTDGIYPIKECITIYNRKTSIPYQQDAVIRNTDIKNGTELVLS